MAKFLKIFDPNETYRRIGLEIREDNCPGLIEFLALLPYGFESSVLRSGFYQWYLENKAKGDLEQAVRTALTGLGGSYHIRRPSEAVLESLACLNVKPAASKRARSAKVSNAAARPSGAPQKGTLKSPLSRKASAASKS
jgi:hypothetical protein